MSVRAEPAGDQSSPGGTNSSPPMAAKLDVREPWRDPSLPVDVRVTDLLGRMTLTEKIAQLSGLWIGLGTEDSDGVAPMQGEFAESAPLAELIKEGVGQLTRVLGTVPVTPAEGAAALARLQRRITAASRFGIPALAHEECLTGFAAWGATTFPAPPAWGASFDPDAVRKMAASIGEGMHAVGVHQGLAPVLDVTMDARWGRVEESIGADPYLVGMIGTAYVQGLQSAGIIATLKHFAGYSASRAARNMAPVDMGPRQLADVIIVPFEMAIAVGGAQSVMPSYCAIDGVPAHADQDLLARRLRDELDFDGTVVSDYFAISFLEVLHAVAASATDAGLLALRAGVDMELPNRRCYGPALATVAASSQADRELIDRAAGRTLRQKFELGLLDPGWSPDAEEERAAIDLDPAEHRDVARLLAEESVVLLANGPAAGWPAERQDVLPLRPTARLALIGPLADDPLAFFGAYSFARHVGYRHSDQGLGLSVTSLLDALRTELPGAGISYAQGCAVRGVDTGGIAAAVSAAAGAELAVLVLGDDAGLFGRGSSGEGSDARDLRLPGVQQELLDAVLETGVPVVLVLVTGRPYALGGVAPRLAAAVQAFFPGQEGAQAIAGVLSGRVTPSGKLPLEIPADPGGQPSQYLRAPLAGKTDVSAVDPTPLYPFGHGLSYTSFEYSDLSVTVAESAADGTVESADADGPDLLIATDGAADIACTVRNSGDRPGTEVVQLYLHDPVAQVVRPVRYLAGFARVALEPGDAKRVVFRLHADRTSFHGRSGKRVVEPGRIDVLVGSSAADVRLSGSVTLSGAERVVRADRVLTTPVTVAALSPAEDAN
jgi:beta-xylosidase